MCGGHFSAFATDRVGEHGNVESLGILEQDRFVDAGVIGAGDLCSRVVQSVDLERYPEQAPLAFPLLHESAQICGLSRKTTLAPDIDCAHCPISLSLPDMTGSVSMCS